MSPEFGSFRSFRAVVHEILKCRELYSSVSTSPVEAQPVCGEIHKYEDLWTVMQESPLAQDVRGVRRSKAAALKAQR